MRRGAICVQRSGGAMMGPMAEAEVSAKVEMGQKMKAKTSGFVGLVKGINDYGDGLVRVLLVMDPPRSAPNSWGGSTSMIWSRWREAGQHGDAHDGEGGC